MHSHLGWRMCSLKHSGLCQMWCEVLSPVDSEWFLLCLTATEILYLPLPPKKGQWGCLRRRLPFQSNPDVWLARQVFTLCVEMAVEKVTENPRLSFRLFFPPFLLFSLHPSIRASLYFLSFHPSTAPFSILPWFGISCITCMYVGRIWPTYHVSTRPRNKWVWNTFRILLLHSAFICSLLAFLLFYTLVYCMYYNVRRARSDICHALSPRVANRWKRLTAGQVYTIFPYYTTSTSDVVSMDLRISLDSA